jgi:hypothetical protein
MVKYVIPARRGKKYKSRSKSQKKSKYVIPAKRSKKSRSKSRSKPRNARPIKMRSYTQKFKKKRRMSEANMDFLENKKKRKFSKTKKKRQTGPYYAESLMFQAPSPSKLPLPKNMISYKPHQRKSSLSFESFTNDQINNLKPVMKKAIEDVFNKDNRKILKKSEIEKMSKLSKRDPRLLTPMMIMEARKKKKPLNIFKKGKGIKIRKRKSKKRQN